MSTDKTVNGTDLKLVTVECCEPGRRRVIRGQYQTTCDYCDETTLIDWDDEPISLDDVAQAIERDATQ